MCGAGFGQPWDGDTTTFTGDIWRDGNVDIGTTNPGAYKLWVEGDLWANNLKTSQKIEATEIEVKATVTPDFVFENDYNLRSIKEVEQFIKSNKHLPEIPSAAEVEANGNKVNLGEMQTKLLQKIEELTLYLIEQNKQLIELKKENREIKAELAAMKK